MALLEYLVSTDDELNFGDAERIERGLFVEGVKVMLPGADPTIDPTILRPDEAFRVE